MLRCCDGTRERIPGGRDISLGVGLRENRCHQGDGEDTGENVEDTGRAHTFTSQSSARMSV